MRDYFGFYFVTGSADPDEKPTSGAKGVLRKPIPLEILEQIIRNEVISKKSN
ncbi:MAG: hypothetical protein R2827_14575 [Bdellovibrionales bacterium]